MFCILTTFLGRMIKQKELQISMMALILDGLVLVWIAAAQLRSWICSSISSRSSNKSVICQLLIFLLNYRSASASGGWCNEQVSWRSCLCTPMCIFNDIIYLIFWYLIQYYSYLYANVMSSIISNISLSEFEIVYNSIAIYYEIIVISACPQHQWYRVFTQC